MNVDLSYSSIRVPLRDETIMRLREIAESNNVDIEGAATIILTAAVYDFDGLGIEKGRPGQMPKPERPVSTE